MKTTEANWMIKGDALQQYLHVCQRAATDDTTFNLFKSLDSFTRILEHLDKRTAENYITKIKEYNPWLLDISKFFTNDLYGSPKRVSFKSIYASPSTIQYIGVLSNLINQIGTLHDLSICEIGGGYGGQCKIINDAFGIKSYHIIDLYEVTLLQDKYLKKFNCNFKTFTPENYPLNHYDLVISNYAITEVNEPLRSKYINDILLNSRHGYITCNTPLDTTELKKKFNLSVSPDVQGETETNYILSW
jgi:putative sugar O-methyltransferase